ncbi:AIR carboxylase family protein, partial [bacterium]|nr:AIR carboxylase family protein [bacterium]
RSSNSIDGWDSLLSIVQMPTGVPVATVAVNGAANAGILAGQILATGDSALLNRIDHYKSSLSEKVMESIRDSGLTDPLKS